MVNKYTDAMHNYLKRCGLKLESAYIKLLLLKENFEYRDDFKSLAKILDEFPYKSKWPNPLKVLEAYEKLKIKPDNLFEKYGLYGAKNIMQSLPVTEILYVLDPKNDIEFDTLKGDIKTVVINIFYSPAIIQVQVKKSQLDGIFCTAADKLELKPYERLLKFDFRKDKKIILNEFNKYCDVVTARYKDSIKGDDENTEHYLSWKPYLSRKRNEIMKQWQIWRLRDEVKQFSKVAKKLNISEDRAKKAFYRFYELSQNKKYDPEIYSNYKNYKKPKPCTNCINYSKCDETGQVCPEVMCYLERGQRKSTREKLADNYEIQLMY